MAPPGVAFLGWLQLNGDELDAMARILHGLTMVFLGLVLTQAPGLLKLPFSISWWALSFPVAALTTSTLKFAELSGSTGFLIAGGIFLAVLCVIVAFLVLRTGIAVVRQEICLPD
jgi:tellurite resistance protein